MGTSRFFAEREAAQKRMQDSGALRVWTGSSEERKGERRQSLVAHERTCSCSQETRRDRRSRARSGVIDEVGKAHGMASSASTHCGCRKHEPATKLRSASSCCESSNGWVCVENSRGDKKRVQLYASTHCPTYTFFHSERPQQHEWTSQLSARTSMPSGSTSPPAEGEKKIAEGASAARERSVRHVGSLIRRCCAVAAALKEKRRHAERTCSPRAGPLLLALPHLVRSAHVGEVRVQHRFGARQTGCRRR